MVTVALGSTVATILLSKDVTLVEGLVALALLVGLQYVVAYAGVRVPTGANLVKSEPTLVVRTGEMLHGAMRRERVASAEIEQAARINGVARVTGVEAMIIGTDGSVSVVPSTAGGMGRDR